MYVQGVGSAGSILRLVSLVVDVHCFRRQLPGAGARKLADELEGVAAEGAVAIAGPAPQRHRSDDNSFNLPQQYHPNFQ